MSPSDHSILQAVSFCVTQVESDRLEDIIWGKKGIFWLFPCMTDAVSAARPAECDKSHRLTTVTSHVTGWRPCHWLLAVKTNWPFDFWDVCPRDGPGNNAWLFYIIIIINSTVLLLLLVVVVVVTLSQERCECCDQYICMYACLSVCLYVCLSAKHVLKLHAIFVYVRLCVVFWRRCNMLCTSGSVCNVMCSYNGTRDRAYRRRYVWSNSPGSGVTGWIVTGTKSAILERFVVIAVSRLYYAFDRCLYNRNIRLPSLY